MKGIWAVSVLAGILLLSIGLSQEVFAVEPAQPIPSSPPFTGFDMASYEENVYLAWISDDQTGDANVWLQHSPNGGYDWGDPQNLTNLINIDHFAFGDLDVKAYSNSVFVTYTSAGDRKVVFQYSHNNGVNFFSHEWASCNILSPESSEIYLNGYAIYLTFFNTCGPAIGAFYYPYVVISNNGGYDFEDPIILNDDEAIAFNKKIHLKISSPYVYALWENKIPNLVGQLTLRASSNNGDLDSWGAVIRAFDYDIPGKAVYRLEADGSDVFVYLSTNEGSQPDSLVVRKAINGAQTPNDFLNEQLILTGADKFDTDFSSFTGNFHVTEGDFSGPIDQEIHSSADGITFNPLYSFNYQTGNGMPHVVSHETLLASVFPVVVNDKITYYYSRSSDGGQIFTEPEDLMVDAVLASSEPFSIVEINCGRIYIIYSHETTLSFATSVWFNSAEISSTWTCPFPPPPCAADEIDVDTGKCVPKCAANEILVDGECVPKCAADEIDVDTGKCVPKCAANEILVDGECVPIDCDTHEIAFDKEKYQIGDVAQITIKECNEFNEKFLHYDLESFKREVIVKGFPAKQTAPGSGIFIGKVKFVDTPVISPAPPTPKTQFQVEDCDKVTATYDIPGASMSTPSPSDVAKITSCNVFPSPLMQIKSGVLPKDVQCQSGKDLMIRPSGRVACVNESSIPKLLELGWQQSK